MYINKIKRYFMKIYILLKQVKIKIKNKAIKRLYKRKRRQSAQAIQQ